MIGHCRSDSLDVLAPAVTWRRPVALRCNASSPPLRVKLTPLLTIVSEDPLHRSRIGVFGESFHGNMDDSHQVAAEARLQRCPNGQVESRRRVLGGGVRPGVFRVRAVARQVRSKALQIVRNGKDGTNPVLEVAETTQGRRWRLPYAHRSSFHALYHLPIACPRLLRSPAVSSRQACPSGKRA